MKERLPHPERSTAPSQPVARMLALVLGGVTAFNLVWQVIFGADRTDLNLWWIDLRPLPKAAAFGLLMCGAVLLLGFALRFHMHYWRKLATLTVLGVLSALSVGNVVVFYHLLLIREITSAFPVPVSLFVLIALAILMQSLAGQGHRWKHPCIVAGITLFGLLGGIPLVHMICFGQTDYRRPADAVVIFGAGVTREGDLSLALKDRMRQGVELYRRGMVAWLIVSGGPGPGSVHETEAMRDYAIQHGVSADAILMDPEGVDTHATAQNTHTLRHRYGFGRILAVSHFYHLPRIKLACQQEGMEVYTVPAPQQRILHRMPYYMAREAAALWVYYLTGG